MGRLAGRNSLILSGQASSWNAHANATHSQFSSGYDT